MPTVLVTDAEFERLDIERRVLGEAGIDLIAASTRTPEEVAAIDAEPDALLVQYAEVTPAVLDRWPDLRAVGIYGIGVDNVAVAAATERGIPVLNVPRYCEDEVAEHALALLFALERAVPAYDRSVKAGDWDWHVGAPVTRIAGKTLGIVGLGDIGRTLAAKVEGLGLDVLAYDPYLDADAVTERGATKVGLGDLLERSDAVSIHAPLTDETRGLFDAEAFDAMRGSAILLNVARGGIVDAAALERALETGEIRGAGLDVLPEEPPGDDSLLARDDVVVTPHAAWYSEDSLVDLRETISRDLARVLSGERPRNVVNPEALE